MQDTECPFCTIAQGRDDAAKVVCEGDEWVAFFPRNPATPGHTLVIPREHVTDLWAVNPELCGPLLCAVVQVGNAIREALTPAGLNLISSSGEIAEQSIYHLHLHVVPRYSGDPIDPIWPPRVPMDEQLKEELALRIRAACSRPKSPPERE
jgi:diadenosine tetraphosphate (Ap4A) HIT family hydrolase